MGSCHCRQQLDVEQVQTIQIMSPRYSAQQIAAVIKIQALVRMFLTKKNPKFSIQCKFSVWKATKQSRTALQKRSNSTDDCSLEPKSFQKMRKDSPIHEFEQKHNTIRIEEEERDKSASMVMQKKEKQQDSNSKVRSGSFSPGDTDLKCQSLSPSKNLIKSVQFKDVPLRKYLPFKVNCILTSEPILRHEKLIIKLQSHNQFTVQQGIKLVNGNVYKGSWKNCLPDGHGRYTFSDQSYYIGDFSNGMLHGNGVFYSKQGITYKGQWHQNMMQGQGKYTQSDGSYYEGQWFKDQQHGDGVELYKNGSKYRGEFSLGVKNGLGILEFKDGSCYDGQFLMDDMNGEGIYRWKDGRIYKGFWLNGMMNGEGELTFPDGKKYKGEYRNDQKHGYGVFEFADGRKYCGFWKNGLQDGEGEFFKQNGQSTKGIWNKGRLIHHLNQ